MTRKRLYSLSTLMAILVAALTAAPALYGHGEHDELFQTVPGEEDSDTRRVVRMNFQQLEPVAAIARSEQERTGWDDSPINVPAGEEPKIQISLVRDVRFTAVIDTVQHTKSGYGMSGNLEGTQFGTMSMVVNGDIVAGTVQSREALYEIKTLDDRKYSIEKVDAAQRGRHPAPVRMQPGDGTGQQAPGNGDDGEPIDVMVLYTPRAEQGAGGRSRIEAEIDNFFRETNKAYRDSGVKYQAPSGEMKDHWIRLVHTEKIKYTESATDQGIDLDHISDSAEISQLRNKHKADLVHLITNEATSSCGVAWRSYPLHPTGGFGVTARTTPTGICGSRTFAHELGHNMGLKHDRYTVGNIDSGGMLDGGYNYGYVNPQSFGIGTAQAECWHTVMAYHQRCSNAGKRPVPLMRFSNPQQGRNGVPLGVPSTHTPTGLDGPADAARALRENWNTIANFRQSPGTPGLPCTRPIEDGERVHGRWPSRCDSEVKGRGSARYYKLTIPDGTPRKEYTITLESNNTGKPDPYLYLRDNDDRNGVPRAENDDAATGNRASKIVEILDPGYYTIETTTYAPGEGGEFTLKVTSRATRDTSTAGCVTVIDRNSNTDGVWNTSCRSETRPGNHTRYYRFTLGKAAEVTVRLESSDSGAEKDDTYLYLRRNNATSGPAVHENDDHNRNIHVSLIKAKLEAGTYTIEATTYSPGETGSFKLFLNSSEAGSDPPATGDCTSPIERDGSLQGQWTTGCRSETEAPGGPGRRHAKFYRLTLSQEAEVAVTLRSTEADAYLYIRRGVSQSGDPVNTPAIDDDAGSGTNAYALENLQAGTYTIEATTHDPGDTGLFTITVSRIDRTENR